MKDEIEELYGAMREREEASWDPLLRNYYAGYCDALRTIYSFLTGESGRNERIALRGIEEKAKAEETGKEPPEETGTEKEEGRYIKKLQTVWPGIPDERESEEILHGMLRDTEEGSTEGEHKEKQGQTRGA